MKTGFCQWDGFCQDSTEIILSLFWKCADLLKQTNRNITRDEGAIQRAVTLAACLSKCKPTVSPAEGVISHAGKSGSCCSPADSSVRLVAEREGSTVIYFRSNILLFNTLFI